jgi:hypothetical protein
MALDWRLAAIPRGGGLLEEILRFYPIFAGF